MSDRNENQYDYLANFYAQRLERNIKRRRVAKKLARMRYKPIYRLEHPYKLRNRLISKKVVCSYFFLQDQWEQEDEASEGLEEWYKKYHSTE